MMLPERLVEAEILLQRILRKADEALKAAFDTVTGGDEHLPILLNSYHALELIDAATILVRKGSVRASQLQQRSVFEALLAVDYIMQANTVRRAHAYLVVADVLPRLRSYDLADPASAVSANLRRLVGREGTPHWNWLDHVPPVDTEAARAGLRRLLDRPLFKEALTEYEKVKAAKRRRSPDWYELYEGPQGLENLAATVGWGSYYQILYRLWSRHAHGEQLVRRVKPGPAGGVVLEPWRDGHDVETAVNVLASFSLHLMRRLLEFYLPAQKEAWAGWYVADVRPLWSHVTGALVRLAPDLPA